MSIALARAKKERDDLQHRIQRECMRQMYAVLSGTHEERIRMLAAMYPPEIVKEAMFRLPKDSLATR